MNKKLAKVINFYKTLVPMHLRDDGDLAGQKEWVVSSVNIRDYFENLSNHDWYYEYSDDQSVYKRGSYAKSALLRTAGTHSTYKEMYKQFAKWVREERERPEIMEFLNEV